MFGLNDSLPEIRNAMVGENPKKLGEVFRKSCVVFKANMVNYITLNSDWVGLHRNEEWVFFKGGDVVNIDWFELLMFASHNGDTYMFGKRKLREYFSNTTRQVYQINEIIGFLNHLKENVDENADSSS